MNSHFSVYDIEGDESVKRAEVSKRYNNEEAESLLKYTVMPIKSSGDYLVEKKPVELEIPIEEVKDKFSVIPKSKSYVSEIKPKVKYELFNELPNDFTPTKSPQPMEDDKFEGLIGEPSKIDEDLKITDKPLVQEMYLGLEPQFSEDKFNAVTKDEPDKELLDNYRVKVDQVMMKPLVRVRTGLDLSESVEIAEGNNGPILSFEDDKQSPKANGIPPKLELNNKDELWRLPMSQWPKPKFSNNKDANLLSLEGYKRNTSKKNESLRKLSIKKASETSSDSKGTLYNFYARNINKDGPIYKFVAGHSTKPRDDEEGEDACFAFERGLGVADGISGWSTYGINSSVFSQRLMEECEDEIRRVINFKKGELLEIKRHRIPKVASYVGLDFQANTIYETEYSEEEGSEPEATSNLSKRNKRIFETLIIPLQVLTAGYNKALDIGSSTATIAVLNYNEVEAVNLGDSGFMHFAYKNHQYYIRNVSKEQQHEFNVPYQLSRLPSVEYLMKMESEGRLREAKQLRRLLDNGKICKDDPEVADQYTYEVNEGDIFILGTDGLFDNIFSYEAKNIVNNCMFNVSKITSRIAKV
jgi:serine/threonine protein phosphatase PrpC